MREVAQLAGVSRSAVSRTFTDGASVSTATRAKVEAAAAALGYAPSLIASSLTTGRTRLIGLIANNFRNPVFLQVFDLFTRALQARDYRPLLVNLTDETDPAQSVQMLRRYSVDGVIVATSTLPDDFARAFHEARIPVVHAFGRAGADLPVPIVGIDNVACGEMAAMTLIARGYQNIGVIGGPAGATSTIDRLLGFSRAMAKAGCKIAYQGYAANYTHTAGRAAMDELLATAKVDAVFCGDDLICIGAMDAARAAGRAIPADIGFLGFNDADMAAWQAYDLTTIRQPIAEIISTAAELIMAMESATPATPRLFPCEIVERGTLRPLPAQ